MSPKADAVIADGYGGDEVEAAEIGRDAVDALLALHPEGVAILPDRQVRGLEAIGFYGRTGFWGGDVPADAPPEDVAYRLVSVSEAPTRMEEP